MRRNLKGIYVIWLRDIKRFFRDRTRIIGAIGQPALYLFVLGTGISTALQPMTGSGGYIGFLFPGIVGMTILFTSTFSALSIIWDREFGFFKEVMVAPISRTAIALGKALGGTTQSMIQGTIMLVFTPFLDIRITFGSLLFLWMMMFLTSFAMTSFGILLASKMKSIQGFQMISNFLLMPMFFLSGSFFPLKNLPTWMDWLVKVNPLSYGVDGIRYILLGAKEFQAFPLYLDILVMIGAAIVMLTGAIISFNITE
ncbi:MAG: ABC transporter permease [Actinobacteria bacterium]|nr:ABC transporter permease [Actinomycetota bacterium]